jgi:hypothetical protein
MISLLSKIAVTSIVAAIFLTIHVGQVRANKIVSAHDHNFMNYIRRQQNALLIHG